MDSARYSKPWRRPILASLGLEQGYVNFAPALSSSFKPRRFSTACPLAIETSSQRLSKALSHENGPVSSGARCAREFQPLQASCRHGVRCLLRCCQSHTRPMSFTCLPFAVSRYNLLVSAVMESCVHLHSTDSMELGTLRESVSEKSKCPQIYRMSS